MLYERSEFMNPYIFNIQKFSLHDGPGIRTTVFFKGCPMKCRWCHNPESQRFEPERMEEILESKQQMSTKQLQIPKGKMIGSQYSVRELVKLLKKDQIFYDQSGGGVTLSGGEVMAQDMDYIIEVLKTLDREGISVVIDTSGFASTENYSEVLPYTELFLYDLKMINAEKHQRYTGVSNKQILTNLKYLSNQGARIELRMIMVKGVNMADEDIAETISWLQKEQIRLTGITLLSYHDFGRDKYRKLNRECTQNFEKPSEEELNHIKKLLENSGYKVTIQN